MSAIPCECGAVGDGFGGCSKCLGAGEVYGSGEAGGLEAVLAAHATFGWDGNDRYRCRCGEALVRRATTDALPHYARHVAAAVRVWLAEALAAPEVVEAEALRAGVTR